jgi:hypothetical protein
MVSMNRVAMLLTCLVCNIEFQGSGYRCVMWVGGRVIHCNVGLIINYAHQTVLISASGIYQFHCVKSAENDLV